MEKLISNYCRKDLEKQIEIRLDTDKAKERFKVRKCHYQAIKTYCKNIIDEVKAVLIHSKEICLLQAGKTIRVIPNLTSWRENRKNVIL